MKKKHSIGKIIAISLFAFLLGWLQPLSFAMSVLFVGGTVLAVTFYAWAGPVPALAYLITSAYSLYGLYGLSVMNAGLFLIALPAVIVIHMMNRGFPYFTRLKVAVAAQLGAVMLVIVALYLGYRQDLINVLMSALKSWANGMDPALVSLALNQFALTGSLNQQAADLVLSGQLSAKASLDMLLQILELMDRALRMGLAAMLLSSGILTGILATVIPGKICSRRGDGLQYIPLSGWYITPRLTIGVAVCMAAAFVLQLAGVAGAEPVMTAISTAASLMFMIGGAAAMSRRFKANGHSKVYRAVVIGIGVLLVSPFITMIGVASALFGRRGMVSSYIRKKKEEQDKGDN